VKFSKQEKSERPPKGGCDIQSSPYWDRSAVIKHQGNDALGLQALRYDIEVVILDLDELIKVEQVQPRN